MTSEPLTLVDGLGITTLTHHIHLFTHGNELYVPYSCDVVVTCPRLETFTLVIDIGNTGNWGRLVRDPQPDADRLEAVVLRDMGASDRSDAVSSDEIRQTIVPIPTNRFSDYVASIAELEITNIDFKLTESPPDNLYELMRSLITVVGSVKHISFIWDQNFNNMQPLILAMTNLETVKVRCDHNGVTNNPLNLFILTNLPALQSLHLYKILERKYNRAPDDIPMTKIGRAHV